MKRTATILLTAALAIGPLAACGSSGDDASSTTAAETTATTAASNETTATTAAEAAGPGAGGPGGGIDVDSVATVEALDELIQEAYGDGSLDLHRGHQPVQDVLDAVLVISHEELHVYMEEQNLNLAAVATEVGVEPQELIDALVAAWSPAIDNVLAAGAITEDQAADYLTALEEAFTYRVNWDGEEATPTFAGLA